MLKPNANPTESGIVGCSLQSGVCSVVVYAGHVLDSPVYRVHGFGDSRTEGHYMPR